MADAPPKLDYADTRRGSRRRFWMTALVISAIACGIVGRLLYARLNSFIGNRFEAVAAQKAVDALKPSGVPFNLGLAQSREVQANIQTTRDAIAISLAARRILIAQYSWPPAGGIVALTRIQNVDRRERVVCVSLTPGYTSPVSAVTIIVTTTAPGTFFGRDAGARKVFLTSLTTYRNAFHLDAPTLDPGDPRRLLLTGTADGVPFARELTIDAADQARIAPIDVPSTQAAR